MREKNTVVKRLQVGQSSTLTAAPSKSPSLSLSSSLSLSPSLSTSLSPSASMTRLLRQPTVPLKETSPDAPDPNTYHILNQMREREEKAMRNNKLHFNVQSQDLHAIVAKEIVGYLDTYQFCDLLIRCKNNQSFHAHRLILASISSFIKELLSDVPRGEVCVLELPDHDADTVSLLLCFVYHGVIEGTLDALREAILLAKDLRMRVPVSREVLDGLFQSQPHVHADLLGLCQPEKESAVAATAAAKVTPKERLPKAKRRRARSRISYAPVTSVATICGDSDRVCALCRDTCLAENIADHVRMHDNDPALRAKRHAFLESLVCASKDPSSSFYKCHVCLRAFSHSGNFKQHLVRHERECGSFSALLISRSKNGLDFDLSW